MDPKEWTRINEIVDTALELDQKERSTYIQQQCKNNPNLQKQVTELLQSIEQSETNNFLEGPEAYPSKLAVDFTTDDEHSASSLIGETVGHYKIVNLIGHGGMGSVFLTERADNAYEGQVALKLMRRGMDTPSNIARFKRERNILAQLDHPNIARLLDGGITEEGLPYIVMEYVKGTPLLEYYNQHQLSVEERIDLFKSVCRAVKHAHKNAIIHRDLKPSNIFVTEEGQVKVLDFGIAKMLESNDNIFKTRTGARILTLGYAAPEQLEGKQITTGTDAYTLGVVLFELLAGIPPFDIDGKDLTEIEDIIRTQDPQTPSTKVSDLSTKEQEAIANNRKSSPSQLTTKLKGDLDAIVMKSLRKDPEARYNSAEQLLEDLNRRSQNLPIIAREDTWRYNASKFIKRHQTGLSIAAGFSLLVIGFSVFYTWQITKERNHAQRQAQKAEAVTGFLTDLIEANYPQNTQGDTVTVRQFLDKGFHKIQKLNKIPFKQAEIMQVMGYTYRRLGENKKAQQLISKSIPLLKKETNSTVELAKAFDTYGLILRDIGEPQKAVSKFKQAHEALNENDQTTTSIYAKTLRDEAYVNLILDNYDRAESLITKAISIDKKVNGKLSSSLAESYHIYASLLRRQRKYEESLKVQKKSYSILQDIQEGATPGKAANLGNLGTVYNHLDSTRKSIDYYQKAMKMEKKLYGGSHWKIATDADNISRGFFEDGQIDSAKKYSDISLQVAHQALPSSHPLLSNYLENRARIFTELHKFQKADSTFREAFDIAEKHYKPSHTITMDILYNWAQNAAKRKNLKKSADLYTEAFQRQKNAFGMEDSFSKNLLRHLINTERKLDNTAKADSLANLLANN